MKHACSVKCQYYCDIFIHMLFMKHDIFYYYVHDHAKALFLLFFLATIYHECKKKNEVRNESCGKLKMKIEFIHK